MVMQYDAYETLEQLDRPEWQINLRWICGIVATLLLSVSFVGIGLWRASRADVAIPLLQGALVTAFFPEGVEKEQVTEWREQSREFTDIALLDGINLSYNPQDLRDTTGAPLSPRDASLRVVSPLGEAIRERGIARGLEPLIPDETLRTSLTDVSRIHLEAVVQQRVAEVLLGGALSEMQLSHWKQRLDDAASKQVALLDGVDILFGSESIANLSAEDASLALLEPLLDDIQSNGIQAALERITDDDVRARLRQRFTSEGKEALNAAWLTQFFPQGVPSAQRNAWRAQLSATPRIFVDLAQGLEAELNREALGNNGLDAALNAAVEPLSLAYLSQGEEAVFEIVQNSNTQALLRTAFTEAAGIIEAILVSEFYPTGLQDSLRLQLWRTRLDDAQQDSVALIPSLPQRYVRADLEGVDAATAEKKLLEPVVQRYLDEGASASIALISDASIRAQVMDSYAMIKTSLNTVLAQELFANLDDTERLAQWQQTLDAPNQLIEGLPSQLTARLSDETLSGLEPREAGMQLLQPLAEAIYQSDTTQRLYDVALSNKVSATLQPLRFSVALQRGRTTLFLMITLFLTIVFCFVCVILSDDLAKLINIAIIITTASASGAIFWWMTAQHATSIASPPNLSTLALWQYLQTLGSYILSFIPLHFVSFMNQLHVGAFSTGLILLLIGTSLSLGQRWQSQDV